jgi:cytochrome c oxidase subunit 2
MSPRLPSFALALLIALPALATAANVSTLDPVSPPARSIRSLFLLVLAITTGIFVVVEGVLIYNLLRFRRKGTDPAEPPQVYGSKPIEIAWTAAPALIVFVLFLVTARTEWEVRGNPAPPPGSKPLHVTVIGRQWWWEYHYDSQDGKELGIVTANELHVPKGQPVYLNLESADVAHSFWVPRLAGKTDLIPGRTNTTWFLAEEPGLYLGQCAEFCGTQHANMLLRVVVQQPGEFAHWLKEQGKDATEPKGKRARAGMKTFLGQSCVNCHAVRGTRARGTYAPDLTHLMSRQTLGAGIIPNTPDNLWDWVDNPQQFKPGCLMPAFGLSKDEVDDIVAYLLTLR